MILSRRVRYFGLAVAIAATTSVSFSAVAQEGHEDHEVAAPVHSDTPVAAPVHSDTPIAAPVHSGTQVVAPVHSDTQVAAVHNSSEVAAPEGPAGLVRWRAEGAFEFLADGPWRITLVEFNRGGRDIGSASLVLGGDNCEQKQRYIRRHESLGNVQWAVGDTWDVFMPDHQPIRVWLAEFEPGKGVPGLWTTPDQLHAAGGMTAERPNRKDLTTNTIVFSSQHGFRAIFRVELNR